MAAPENAERPRALEPRWQRLRRTLGWIGSTRARRIFAYLVFGLVVFGLGSLVSLYLYGRFAERARGPASRALPPEPGTTRLDQAIAPLIDMHPDRSGLALYTSNVDAFAVRVLTARAAERSLDLQYYLWHDDLTGRLLISEVLSAADRGVRVRLLLDDINAHGSDAELRTLDAHPSIEVRMFNPSRNRGTGFRRAVELLKRGFSLNRRMHNKAWIADNRVAVVGGRNIGDEYFDASAEANFLDADLVVVGPAVEETSEIFDTFWNSAMVIPISALARAPKIGVERLRRRLSALAIEPEARAFLDHVATTHNVRSTLEGKLHWIDAVAVRSDPPDKTTGGPGKGWLFDTVLEAFASAEVRVAIVSPYFVPGDAGMRVIAALRDRGVEVQVLTNSLAATDVLVVHGGYAKYRVPLLNHGAELYEFMPFGSTRSSLFGSSGSSLHTKAFTVDEALGFVGSFNFDPRSVALNTEMGIVFRDPALTESLREAFARKTAADASFRLRLEHGELRWEDRREDPPILWTREPKARLLRRLGATIAGWLPIESQL